jgi:hypothetical protein
VIARVDTAAIRALYRGDTADEQTIQALCDALDESEAIRSDALDYLHSAVHLLDPATDEDDDGS